MLGTVKQQAIGWGNAYPVICDQATISLKDYAVLSFVLWWDFFIYILNRLKFYF